MRALRALLAVATLRARGAASARLPWLVVVAFAIGVLAASWAPGATERARAASADSLALAACGALALLVSVLLGATTFASEVASGSAQPIVATPVSRFAVATGGVLGHGFFALGLLLAMAMSASLGLEVGGLGFRARTPVRPFTPATVEGVGREGFADLDVANPSVRATFTIPKGLDADEPLHIHLSPHCQIERGLRTDGLAEVSLSSPDDGGHARSTVRVAFKAGVPFDVALPRGTLAPGDAATLSIRRPEGMWRLRFTAASVEVGGASQLFGWNVLKAVLCLAPLLFTGAALGALSAARLGAGAAAILVLFLALLLAGREVINDGAKYILEAAAMEAERERDLAHDHESHDHDSHDHAPSHVSALQTTLAKGALVATSLYPDADDYWRFGDVADSRAVTSADLSRSARRGLPTVVVLLGIGWLLLRRREMLAQ